MTKVYGADKRRRRVDITKAVVGSQELPHVIAEAAIFEVTGQAALCFFPLHPCALGLPRL